MSRREIPAGARLVLLALAVTAARLVFAGAIHLTEDEAYYRIWAEHLQAGYLDHPPMIAWWIWLGEQAAGATPLGVRLLPTLATGLTTWLLGDLARIAGLSERTAFRTALWYNATFTVALGGMLATPDTPTCLFWTLTLWCLAREARSGRGAWWLGAGAAAGLSCLSKYSGLFLAPGVFLWLAVKPGGWTELKRPWPWLAAIVAALVFAPNLAWNVTHGWLTFDKQFGRVGAHGLHLGRLPEFLVTQFLLLNPLIAVLSAAAAREAWRLRRDPARGTVVMPLAVALPFLVYLTLHSLHDRVQGHWPVPAFGALALAAALAAETRPAWWRSTVPALGLGLSALALAHMSLPRSGYLGPFDPTLAIRNWDGFAGAVETLRREEGAAWVGVQSYGVLAQLRNAAKIQAPVIQIIERPRYFDWDKRIDASRPGLVLDLDRRMKPEQLRRCFAVVEPAGALDRGPNRGPARRYLAFRVQGPKYDLIRQGCPWST